MASTTGYSNAEVKAGVLLTISAALFIAMLFIYGKVARVWRGRQEITVLFTSVTALRQDAPVRLNGYEVGRVKNVSILHLKSENIHRLPNLRPEDLENLPLTEKEQRELRGLTAAEFPLALERKLADRTMIQLILEVISERDPRRFREDDQVRISTTLMGDTAVEISSGSGAALSPGRLLLGNSGDFFTNLVKTLEQVKELLGSVSDVVGRDERESVRRALRRIDTITERLDKIVTLADERLPDTWTRVDELADSAKLNLDRIGDTVTSVQPQVTRTLTTADEAIKDLRERLGKLSDETQSAVTELRGEAKPILADLQYMTSKSKDDFPALVKNAKDLAMRLQESADKVDTVLASGDRLLQESYPDLRRLVLALRMGAENFEEATNLLKRKPWLIYNPAKEDPALAKAQKAARDLEIATKRFAELSVELQALRRNMDQAPKERLDRLDFVLQELNVLSDTLKYAGEVSKKEVLPPFERKKTSFVPLEEVVDPDLKKKAATEAR